MVCNSLLDLVFPRICLSCREGTADKVFCRTCWELLELSNPRERCRHCFALGEEEICKICCQNPALCFPRVYLFEESFPAKILMRKMSEARAAFAGFSFIFWQRLDWDLPDMVIPIPDQNGSKAIFEIAKIFSKFIERPFKKVLYRTYSGFLQPDLSIITAEKQNQKILLFDGGSDSLWLQKACSQTSEIFPKRAQVFSLFYISSAIP